MSISDVDQEEGQSTSANELPIYRNKTNQRIEYATPQHLKTFTLEIRKRDKTDRIVNGKIKLKNQTQPHDALIITKGVVYDVVKVKPTG